MDAREEIIIPAVQKLLAGTKFAAMLEEHGGNYITEGDQTICGVRSFGAMFIVANVDTEVAHSVRMSVNIADNELSLGAELTSKAWDSWEEVWLGTCEVKRRLPNKSEEQVLLAMAKDIAYLLGTV